MQTWRLCATNGDMVRYFVKGADDESYGPVSLSDLRHWILDGRLQESSPVSSDGEIWTLLGEDPALCRLLDRPRDASPQPIPSGLRIRPFLALKFSLHVLSRHWKLFVLGLSLWMFLQILLSSAPKALAMLLTSVGVSDSLSAFSDSTVSFLLQSALAGPLLVGLYRFCLGTIDARPSLSDLGDGFSIFLPSMFVQWIKLTIFFGVLMLIALGSVAVMGSHELKAVIEQMQQGQAPPISGILLMGASILTFIFLMFLLLLPEMLLADRVCETPTGAVGTGILLALRHLAGLIGWALLVPCSLVAVTAPLFAAISLIPNEGWQAVSMTVLGLFFFCSIITLMTIGLGVIYRQIVPRGCSTRGRYLEGAA